ncbi:MAG: glycosyltransferase family 2 protein [Cellvibrionaceae bacterium]
MSQPPEYQSSDASWIPCITVPVYNHEEAVGIIIDQLLTYNIPIILVDDGSDCSCKKVLQEIERRHGDVILISLSENIGKGGAVKAGLREAKKRKFTHVLQIDADGQHAVGDVPKFFALAKERKSTLITGIPVYDETVPAVRFYARYLTHVWIHINTLSLSIKDSMCGFRVYPVEEVFGLIETEFTGNRMDFDSEVLVKWFWRGGDVLNVPTKVNYPLDGVSHFSLWKDNYLITKMHTRLFFGMLIRSPKLFGRLMSRHFFSKKNTILNEDARE